MNSFSKPTQERDIIMTDFSINNKDALLLIIDIQDKLFKAMDDDTQKSMKKNTGILIKTASEFHIPMIISEQYRKGLGETIPELKELAAGALNLEKLYFDCMKDEDLKKAVHKTDKKTVIITGIESHICVLQTALSLLGEGKRVIIASDGVGSRRTEDKDAALQILSSARALIYPTETIAFMILEKAGTPEFKKLSPLFK